MAANAAGVTLAAPSRNSRAIVASRALASAVIGSAASLPIVGAPASITLTRRKSRLATVVHRSAAPVLTLGDQAAVGAGSTAIASSAPSASSVETTSP